MPIDEHLNGAVTEVTLRAQVAAMRRAQASSGGEVCVGRRAGTGSGDA